MAARFFLASILLTSMVSVLVPVYSRTLQGNVSEEDLMPRLARPTEAVGGNQPEGALRLRRPSMAASVSGDGLKGIVDRTAFGSPLRGRVDDNGGRLGVLEPAQFDSLPNSKFDLGAERGSRELTLAWEAWHKQLSREIYSRWSDVAALPGQATLRITVTRQHTITPHLVRSSGNPEFDRVLIETVMSLNGNPGLTFPAKSERNHVSFEADYLASTNIQPGFSWVRNDYEHIHKDY